MVWWLLACVEKEGDGSAPPEPESPSDTDDTDSPPETSTPTTGSTGDTGEGEPTGDTGTPLVCVGVEAELVPFLEARDNSGPCTTCDVASIEFYTGFRNPCEVDIELEVAAGCDLTRDFQATAQDGSSFGTSAPCNGPITTRTVFAGDQIEEHVFRQDMTPQMWQVEAIVGSSNHYVVGPIILTVL
jgi:hypothetical protein